MLISAEQQGDSVTRVYVIGFFVVVFFFLFVLGPCQWHMEVPRLGVE